MSTENLGNPLTNAYSIPGGQARIYERGMTVSLGAKETSMSFHFPMIGRPSIVTGNPATARLFPTSALRFLLNHGQPNQLTPKLQAAFNERLALVPTGQSTAPVFMKVVGTESIGAQPNVPLGHGPGVYSISVAAPGLKERQLYDVAIRADNGQWQIVAPHAVYYRQAWTDFGIACVNDIHVARRIDSFREILKQAGRTEGVGYLYNWNDRFRGFVKYANYLHSIGELDLILAIGDVYDYIYEDDDDPASGGNAAFLRQLILGQAPGPDFPNVEELKVPIFMTPGNHDYRKHPYKLFFDLHLGGDWLGKDLERIKNSQSYHLLDEDAKILNNRLDGSTSSDVQNHGPDTAARMVAIDPDIKAYKMFLSDRLSYTLQLGIHRIAMLDSGPDTGMVTDIWGAIADKLGYSTEDENTFLGGGPNSKGISAEQLKMVSDALTETPDGGLFILGVHAPLFNTKGDAYPYFLRETQRPAQPDQTYGFLVQQGDDEVDSLSEVENRHPSWFHDQNNHPSFVKRVDSQDLLDAGVSRGKAEELMRLLAGVGAPRPGDLVLSGHVHTYNEFKVRKNESTGELTYFMDFYTQNPAHYYPTRFTQRWDGGKPVTDVTYVVVTPSAEPDGTPQLITVNVNQNYKYQLDVPPYPKPLSSAPDPRTWWTEHRPLVLQTGALGPLKNWNVRFEGFRMVSVKNNVIDKIHFISIEKLEANKFQLAWEEAIRPEPLGKDKYPVSRYRVRERSQFFKTPAADGKPSGIAVPHLNVTNVIYRGTDGRLHELWQRGALSGKSDLTTLAGAVRAADDSTGDPTSYVDTIQGLLVTPYRGTDGHVHSLYWSTGPIGRDALSHTAGGPTSAGKPSGYVDKDRISHVIYRAGNGHLIGLWWSGPDKPGCEDLTSATPGAPAAIGDPIPYINTNTGEHIVAYRGTDKHIHTIYWTGAGAPGHDNLSGFAQAPQAVGDPIGYYIARYDSHQVLYRSSDGHIHELFWIGASPVTHSDLTIKVGAPPAASDPVGYYSPGLNTKHVIYRSQDGHLHDISWIPGDSKPPVHVDVTQDSLAPLAVDKPAAFEYVDGRNHHQYIVYRGAEGRIFETLRTLQPMIVLDPNLIEHSKDLINILRK